MDGRQAGWGDLLGGVTIVVTRIETGHTFIGQIPVSFFQGPSFHEKQYLDKAVEVVLSGIRVLDVPQSELIRICTGYVLSKVRREVWRLCYNMEPAKITGHTHELAEEAFVRGLEQIDLSSVLMDAGKRGFSNQLKWVHEDLAVREKHVKTGWPSWAKRLSGGSSNGTKSKE